MSVTHLALFDLDHTLLDGDSNTLWLEFLVREGHVPASVLLQQTEYMAHYAAQTLNIDDYLAFHLRLLVHRPVAQWQPVLARFLSACIAPRISDAARKAVARHLGRNDRLAIITATHDFLSGPIGGLFGIPVMAPQAEILDGWLTGRIIGPICFRAQKLVCLARWMTNQRATTGSIGNRYFYTDSVNDVPLLEAVSHPVVVNGDEALSLLAAERGWSEQEWRVSLPAMPAL